MNLNTAYIDTSKLDDEKRILQTERQSIKYNTPPSNMTSLTTANSPSSSSPSIVVSSSIATRREKYIQEKVINVEKHKKTRELLTFIEKIPLSAIGKVQRGVLEEHVYDIVRKNLK